MACHGLPVALPMGPSPSSGPAAPWGDFGRLASHSPVLVLHRRRGVSCGGLASWAGIWPVQGVQVGGWRAVATQAGEDVSLLWSGFLGAVWVWDPRRGVVRRPDQVHGSWLFGQAAVQSLAKKRVCESPPPFPDGGRSNRRAGGWDVVNLPRPPRGTPNGPPSVLCGSSSIGGDFRFPARSLSGSGLVPVVGGYLRGAGLLGRCFALVQGVQLGVRRTVASLAGRHKPVLAGVVPRCGLGLGPQARGGLPL